MAAVKNFASSLSPTAAQRARLENAGRSVMNAVCCAAICPSKPSRARTRIVHAILNAKFRINRKEFFETSRVGEHPASYSAGSF
jgi:hypothetical protein